LAPNDIALEVAKQGLCVQQAETDFLWSHEVRSALETRDVALVQDVVLGPTLEANDPLHDTSPTAQIDHRTG